MQPVHIRFGGYQPPASMHSQAAEILGKALATRLGQAVCFALDGTLVASGHQATDLLKGFVCWASGTTLPTFQ